MASIDRLGLFHEKLYVAALSAHQRFHPEQSNIRAECRQLEMVVAAYLALHYFVPNAVTLWFHGLLCCFDGSLQW
jgi:hypothetical protein